MRELYESPELNIISFVPAENLANDFGFGDISVGNGMSNKETPVESTDIGIDF